MKSQDSPQHLDPDGIKDEHHQSMNEELEDTSPKLSTFRVAIMTLCMIMIFFLGVCLIFPLFPRLADLGWGSRQLVE